MQGEKRFQQTDVRFVCGKSWGELASPYPHTKFPFPWAIGSRFGSRTRKYVRDAHKSLYMGNYVRDAHTWLE